MHVYPFPLPGYYCDAYALTSPSGPCTGGFYCPGGQNTSTPTEYVCSPGHECPQGSDSQLACQSGTYQDNFGMVIRHLIHHIALIGPILDDWLKEKILKP